MKNETPSVEYLRECFDYSPDSGEVVWRARPLHHFSAPMYQAAANTRYAGKVVGSLYVRSVGGDYKCLTVRVCGKHYGLHRIIWKMYFGEEPPSEIDHINHDATDNRICNLRDGSGVNRKNMPLFSNNTSGHSGVSWHKGAGKWRARTKVSGKEVHLGLFDSYDEACRRMRDFFDSSGFHANHGKRVEK